MDHNLPSREKKKEKKSNERRSMHDIHVDASKYVHELWQGLAKVKENPSDITIVETQKTSLLEILR